MCVYSTAYHGVCAVDVPESVSLHLSAIVVWFLFSVSAKSLYLCVITASFLYDVLWNLWSHSDSLVDLQHDVNSVICYCFCPSVLVQIQWARVERTGLEVTTVWFDIKLFLVLFLSQCQP